MLKREIGVTEFREVPDSRELKEGPSLLGTYANVSPDSRSRFHLDVNAVSRDIGTSVRNSSPAGSSAPELCGRFRATDEVDYFRMADHTPGIIAAANGTFVRLRDHDQPMGVCVAFPGILDLGERNTLGLDAQCAAGYAVHHLLERVGEYVPRRHASGS